MNFKFTHKSSNSNSIKHSRVGGCWLLPLLPPFALIILVIIITVNLRECEAQDDGLMHQCKGVDLDLTEEHAMSIEDCLKQYNATSIKDISPSNIACVGKCAMEKTGLVDVQGKPHKENIFKFVTDILPPEVHDDIQIKFEKCLDEETEDIDPTDESCVSYLPLCMCIHLAFLEECS